MKKIRIGVMGCANIARRSMIPSIQSLPDQFELVAIASREKNKAEEFANEFGAEPVIGYENLVDRSDIDAIYMPLPTGLHEEWIQVSLAGKKHLLVEKSLAMNYTSARKLADQARAGSLLLMESFMFRYHSQHNFTWQVLKEKRLGDIRLFRSQFGFPPLDKSNFRYNKDLGGGCLLDAAAYTVKAAQWFLGGGLQVTDASLFLDKACDVDVYGSATLMNAEGIAAQLSFGFDNYYQCNYEFWGSKGKLVAERAFTPKPNEQPVISWEKPGEKMSEKQPEDNHFRKIMLEFHRSIQEKQHDMHIDEMVEQSRLLTNIRDEAHKFYV